MEREPFARHLARATRSARACVRTQCWNPRAERVNFLIRPYTPRDDPAPHLTAHEWVRCQARRRERGQRLSAAQVVGRLWVDGRVPAYVNLPVHHAGPRDTTLELCIDRRLRHELADLCHAREGYPPFHVLVPVPPHATDQPAPFYSNWPQWPRRLKLVRWRRWHRLRHRLRGPYSK
jgi:hypothetical protein